ncbi:DUF3365 domain-containing protein [bacterium]|nr:DUF3365 domain-containing protein [bacterium]
MRHLAFYSIAAMLVLTGCTTQGNKKPLTEAESRQYAESGKLIVKTTFEVLSGHLSQALARGGVSEAVTYCNLRAYPLVDSLSGEYNARIKRATIWVRNADNKADADEEMVLKEYAALKSGQKPMKPIVRRKDNGDVAFYMPIQITTPLCLNCHGDVGTDITAADYNIIKKLYPNDNATGHSMEDLRGIWSITFFEKQPIGKEF